MDYQDVLAMVGAGSAHPGGMQSTLRWLDRMNLKPASKVLEVGCGTGRTLHFLASQVGCQCTGVDVREAMIEKAKIRSEHDKLNVNWVVADASRLPFQSESFDLVFTESVNVFVPDMSSALREYLRVLKGPGTYLDVEMTLMSPVDHKWKQEVKKVYGAQRVPDTKTWKKVVAQAGFEDVRVLYSQPLNPLDMMNAQNHHPDTLDLSTPGVYQNPEVLAMLSANSNWLENNYRNMGFVVLEGHKSQTLLA